ncbi:unnamed protein product [Debaryomyces tyrocola]|nr:unnamed protein product [Debaryomyces tyrocola]
MNDDTFAKNIRRYILRGGEDADMDVDTDTDMAMDVDIDINNFDITKFDYRTIFNKIKVVF